MDRSLCSIGLLVLVVGCSTQRMSYVPTTTYDPNDSRNITDEDIRKAFEAQPQLRFPVRVAWYNMGTDDFMAHLIKVHPNIAGSYEVPKCLIEGSRPYFAPRYYYDSPIAIDLKAVRLLAARAKCDLVILVGSRFEESREANGWAFFNAFILPVFWTPFWDARYHYEAEALVFDVRNGYLYKHARSISDEERKRLTIYEVKETAEEVEKQVQKKGEEHLAQEVYALFK